VSLPLAVFALSAAMPEPLPLPLPLFVVEALSEPVLLEVLLWQAVKPALSSAAKNKIRVKFFILILFINMRK
jgi:hypothetical protein